MTKLFVINDNGSAYIYPDAQVTIDWESDFDAPPVFPYTSSTLSRRNSGKTVIAASTHCPSTRLSADAPEDVRLAALGFGEDMKLVRRGKEIAVSDIRKGDRIRIEWTYSDGSVLSREETSPRDGYVYPGSANRRTVYLLERAPFKLPTTPGSVIRVETDEDCDGAAEYVLSSDRIWRGGENGSKFHEDYFEDHFDGDPQILVAGGES